MSRLIAADTETMRGKAFLLTHSTGLYEIHTIHDIFKALVVLSETYGSNRFAFFNLEYDTAAIMRHTGKACCDGFYTDNRAFHGEYGFKALGEKCFQLWNDKHHFYAYDLFPFFQRSLAKSLELMETRVRKLTTFTDHTGRRVRYKDIWQSMTWKYYRANKAAIDRYAVADSAGLQELADKITASLAEIGVETKHYYSPGYIAKKMFRLRGIDFGHIDRKSENFIRQCYYGARIECLQRGSFKHCHEADIKSAYPHSMAQLGDFSSAEYAFSRTIASDCFFVKARVWMPELHLYPLPARTRTNVIFPRYTGQTAFISHYEFNLLEKLGCRLQVQQVLNIRFGNQDRPYKRHILEMYKRRKASGFNGIFWKLCLNSAYGISVERIGEYMPVSNTAAVYSMQRLINRSYLHQFVVAQSRLCSHAARFWEKSCTCNICSSTRAVFRQHNGGGAFDDVYERNGGFYRKTEKNGRMSNVAVGASITAQTRVKVFEAALQAPEKIISIFTDGILSETKLHLCYGGKLGNWEYTPVEKLIVVGCGVYQKDAITKFRSFQVSGINLRELLRHSTSPTIAVPQFSRLSGKLAISRHSGTTLQMNEIYEDEKQLQLNFDSKRHWQRNFISGQDVLSGKIASLPLNLNDIVSGSL